MPYDIRRADPYGIYDRFDFDVPVLYDGDLYDRYRVRLLEMRESVRILKQALAADQPDKPGDILAGKKTYRSSVPAGRGLFARREAEGRAGLLRRSATARQNPYRYHVALESFINLNALEAT